MKIMIRPAVRTGTEKSSRTLVTMLAHTNMGIRRSVMPGARSLKVVVRKLIEPRIELVPSRIRPSTSRSMPWSAVLVESGAYIVHPTGAPPKANDERIRTAPGGMSQKPSALMRGKAMSAAPICSGTTKFATPVVMGITKRKIIVIACSEKSEL